MLDPSDPFLPLLVVCGLAFIIPFIAARLPYVELPVIVAEIVAGIIVGNSGFNIIPHEALDPLLASQWLEFLSLFGFAYLMFLSGIEINFGKISPTEIIFEKGKFLPSLMKDPLSLGVLYFIISFLLCYLASIMLALAGLISGTILMALVLTTTSVGVVVPTIHQAGLMRTEFGQNVLLASLVADFITMLLVTVAFASYTSGISPSLLIIGFLFVAFFAVYKAALLIRERPRIKREIFKKVSKSAEIKVRGAFALMLLFIVLAEILGAEIILGAFLAGAIVSIVSSPEELESLQDKLKGAGYGFFIPIFFIMVGVRFDLSALLASSLTILLAPLLIIIAYVVKLVPALVFRHRYGSGKAVAGGVLMSSRLTLIIAVAAIGLEIGAISSALNAAIILVAVVTSLLSPAIFNTMMKRYSKDGRMKERVAGAEVGEGDEPAEPAEGNEPPPNRGQGPTEDG